MQRRILWRSWGRCLTGAGITGAEARRDHDHQREVVARFAPAEYVAVRLLLPAALVPDVVAAVSYMHVTDDRIDQGGSPAERRAAWERWAASSREALTTGRSEQAVLRALSRSAERHPRLPARVEEFLSGARAEVEWERFTAEAEVDRYVDDYAMPAFMLTAGLLPRPATTEPEFVRACRLLIEAMQRLDWLEDLGEDLRSGRIGIPLDTLATHGMDLESLAVGEFDAVSLARLLQDQAAKAEDRLLAARGLASLVEPEVRPFVRALLRVQGLRLQAVRRSGVALLDAPAKVPKAKALRVLVGETLAGR
ncbi:phytoene/squalene synthase family protein [Streptomyces sp. NPDC014870]|uniref:phytoene/squalene synthase family protein n=1 Tax=Streptomyces sp. NPDC014870 TaxID=3364925 RepID=UPI0037009FDA